MIWERCRRVRRARASTVTRPRDDARTVVRVRVTTRRDARLDGDVDGDDDADEEPARREGDESHRGR